MKLRKNGFSLTEAMVTVCIFGMTLPIMYKLIFETQKYSIEAKISSELQGQGNNALRRISEDLSGAVTIYNRKSFSEANGSGCSFLPEGCLTASTITDNNSYNNYDSSKKYAAVANNFFTNPSYPQDLDSSKSLFPIKTKNNSIYTLGDSTSSAKNDDTRVPSAIAMMSYKKDDVKIISGKLVPLYKFICYYMTLSDEVYYDPSFINQKKYCRKLIRLESKNYYYDQNLGYSASEQTSLNNAGYVSWLSPSKGNNKPALPANLVSSPSTNKYMITAVAINIAPNSTQPNSSYNSFYIPGYPSTNADNYIKTLGENIVPVTGGAMFSQNNNSITVRLILAKGLANIASKYTVALETEIIANNIR